MPRIARIAPGGLAYHILNRANSGLRLLNKDDYFRFRRGLAETESSFPIKNAGRGVGAAGIARKWEGSV